MTNQEKFIKAHQIAKEIKAHCSDYRTAFSLALRQINSEIKQGGNMASLNEFYISDLKYNFGIGMSETSEDICVTIESINDFYASSNSNGNSCDRKYINFSVKNGDLEGKYSVFMMNTSEKNKKDLELIVDDFKFYETKGNFRHIRKLKQVREIAIKVLNKFISKIKKVESEEYEVYKLEFLKPVKGKRELSFCSISAVTCKYSSSFEAYDFKVNESARGDFTIFNPNDESGWAYELKAGFTIRFKAKKSELNLIMSNINLINDNMIKKMFESNVFSITKCD